jgi:hypothetical protein
MSSASTRRKLELARYLECFGGTPKPDAQLFDSE